MPIDLGEVEPHRLELLPVPRAQQNGRPLEGGDSAAIKIVEPGTQDGKVGGGGVRGRVHARVIGCKRATLEDGSGFATGGGASDSPRGDA